MDSFRSRKININRCSNSSKIKLLNLKKTTKGTSFQVSCSDVNVKPKRGQSVTSQARVVESNWWGILHCGSFSMAWNKQLKAFTIKGQHSSWMMMSEMKSIYCITNGLDRGCEEGGTNFTTTPWFAWQDAERRALRHAWEVVKNIYING